MSQNENLPLLPGGYSTMSGTTAYTAQQMREYARAAIQQAGATWGMGVIDEHNRMTALSPWRTIDSAPKDGSWVLVAMKGYPDTVRWVNGGWHDGAGGRLVSPLHWMPIPPLPEVKP